MLVDGVTVEYRRKDGSIAGAQARVHRFRRPGQQRLARRQPVHRRRRATYAPAGCRAVRQRLAAGGDRAQERRRRERRRSGRRSSSLQTYQAQIPALFATNAVLVASDGMQARIGALGAGKEWFKPWRTITGAGRCRRIAGVAGDAGGRVREAALSRSGPPFHRVRGSTAAAARQEDRRLSPVPCRQRRLWRRRCAATESAGRNPRASRDDSGRYDAGRRPAARRAIAASASSGTRRAPARA